MSESQRFEPTQMGGLSDDPKQTAGYRIVRPGGFTKDHMEKLVMSSFLRRYNRMNGTRYHSKKRERPDFLLRWQDRRLLAEVTLAMIEDDRKLGARKFMTRLDTILPDDILEKVERDETTLDRISDQYMGMGHSSNESAEAIERCVLSKCGLFPGYDQTFPMILIVGLGDRGLGKSSVKTFIKPDLHLAVDIPFREVWLNCFACVAQDRGIIRIA